MQIAVNTNKVYNVPIIKNKNMSNKNLLKGGSYENEEKRMERILQETL